MAYMRNKVIRDYSEKKLSSTIYKGAQELCKEIIKVEVETVLSTNRVQSYCC